VARLLDPMRDPAQAVQQRVRFRDPVEDGVRFSNIGADRPRALDGFGFGRNVKLRPLGRHERDEAAADFVEVLEDRIDLRAR
jgi:hypothetical protein